MSTEVTTIINLLNDKAQIAKDIVKVTAIIMVSIFISQNRSQVRETLVIYSSSKRRKVKSESINR